MKIRNLFLTAGLTIALMGCGDDDDSSNNTNNTNNSNNQNPACEAFSEWISDCNNCSADNCNASWDALSADEKTDLEDCATVFENATTCTDFASNTELFECVAAAQMALSLNCTITPECGNGICEEGENQVNCDTDCDPVCDNGICEENEEMTCVMDCQDECGDGECTGDETPETCPQDCDGPYCGNGNCEEGENETNCEEDCVPVCGDGYCTTGEDWQNCPQDCTKTACNYYEEWMSSCEGCAFSVDCETTYDAVDLGTKAILDDCRTTFYSNRGTCDPTGNSELEMCVGYLESVFGYACE